MKTKNIIGPHLINNEAAMTGVPFILLILTGVLIYLGRSPPSVIGKA